MLATVVSDDADFAWLVSAVLRERNWNVRTTSVRSWTATAPIPSDVIVVDLLLQGAWDTWRLLEMLRADEETRSLPIVVCSAAQSELERRTAWIGENGVLVLEKSFDIDDLLVAVEAVLGEDSEGRSSPREQESSEEQRQGT